MEIENLQLKLKNQHRETLAIVELPSKERRPSSNTSSTPFLFCAFQSIACQLEQEVSHLVTYTIFGSFGHLTNIMVIYTFLVIWSQINFKVIWLLTHNLVIWSFA